MNMTTVPPMTIKYLATNLEMVIDQEIKLGNPWVLKYKYPVKDYPFTNVSTINWNKNVFWRTAGYFLSYFILSLVEKFSSI